MSDPQITYATGTYAIVVGIEDYASPQWNREGLATEACEFVHWLLQNGVPADHILLFLAPQNPACLQSHPFPIDVEIRPATQAGFEDAIEAKFRLEEGQAPRSADLLFVFWSGHGVADTYKSRYLLYTDATTRRPRVLQLNLLQSALRSEEYMAIPRQVFCINACAEYIERLSLRMKNFERGNMVISNFGDYPPARSARRQLLFYSSALGKQTTNRPTKPDSFVNLLLSQLKQSRIPPWPPCLASVGEAVKRVFRDLRTNKDHREDLNDFYDEPAYDPELWEDTEECALQSALPAQAPADTGALTSPFAARYTPEQIGPLRALLAALPLLMEASGQASVARELPGGSRLLPYCGRNFVEALTDYTLNYPGGANALVETLERFALSLDLLDPFYTAVDALLYPQVSLRETAALKRLLAREPATAYDLAQRWMPRYAENFRRETGQGRPVWNSITDFLASQAYIETQDPPLFAFAEEFARAVTQIELRKETLQWLARLAPNRIPSIALRSEASTQSADEKISEESPATIGFSPDTSGACLLLTIESDVANGDLYVLRAWLRGGEDDWQNLTPENPAENRQNRTGLPALIARLLEQAHRRLHPESATIPTTDEALRLEFVVPVELLNVVYQWQTDLFGGVPEFLWRRYMVVVRPHERVYTTDANLQDRWSLWWAQLSQHSEPPAIVPFAWEDTYTPERVKQCRVGAKVCAGPLPGSATPGRPDITVMRQLIYAGAPIVFWARPETETAPIRADLETLVRAGALDALPLRIAHAYRQVDTTQGLSRLIPILLWDDPTHLPPDVELQFETLD